MAEALVKLFESFNRLKVLVIGDAMLDAYIWGRVDRISPEAPVPVVNVSHRENRPGGAANVALNIKAMGAMPVLCTMIGRDQAGDEFIRILKKNGLSTEGVLQSRHRKTSVKMRIIGNRHQLLRVDDESTHDLNRQETTDLLKRIRQLLQKLKPQVVIFEDYDKGLFNVEIIRHVLDRTRQAGIPVAVDPKRKNFHHYKGATLFKPNLKELQEGLHLNSLSPEELLHHHAVKEFMKRQKIKFLLVTLSEHGIFYYSDHRKGIIPAHVRNVSDVSGAGDTVISVAALCLAMNCHIAYTASLANLAGGLVCEKVGVMPVDKKQLLEEAHKEGLI